MILKRKELKVMKWFYGCFLILILAGTFYDYEITNLFQGNWTLFARVTEIFGEAPAMAALAVGGVERLAARGVALRRQRRQRQALHLGVLRADPRDHHVAVRVRCREHDIAAVEPGEMAAQVRGPQWVCRDASARSSSTAAAADSAP